MQRQQPQPPRRQQSLQRPPSQYNQSMKKSRRGSSGMAKGTKAVAKGAAKKGAKLALGPIGLAIDWIPIVCKCIFFILSSDYMQDPKGASGIYMLLMALSAYFVATNIKDIADKNTGAVAKISKLFWTAFYGIFILNYGIPTTTEKDNVFINTVKGVSMFFAIVYSILAIIIPLMLIGSLIPGLNFIVIPLSYALEVALLFL
jgi:hypothetical protein